jgi:hypothetical protein
MATASQKQVARTRTANGQFRPGVSGNATGNVHRSRHALNADTIREMHKAFREGGAAAIRKVMKNQPAAFLKLLVLLIPRELKVEQNQSVKSMTDEQLEAAIEYIEAALAAKAGDQAKVIEGIAEPAALPTPGLETQRKRPNQLLEHADSAVGPKERRPRKREVPSPPGG